MYKYLAVAAVMATISSPALANDGQNMDDKAMKKAEECLKEADTNKDNILSKEEFTAYTDRMFTEADTDSNGSLLKTEIVAQKKKEIEKWHAAKKDEKTK